MKLVSIDIGEKNFAFSIITVFPRTPPTLCSSQASVDTQNLNLITMKVENVYLYDVLTSFSKKKKPTIIESCSKITRILETTPDVATCAVVLMEQQTRANIRAQRLAQHIWSYFHTKNLLSRLTEQPLNLQPQNIDRTETNNNPVKLLFVSSKLKTSCFVKEPLTQAERKKWTTDAVLKETIIKLAEQQHIKVKLPKHVLDTIQTLNKKDDVCDTIVQTVAYLIKHDINIWALCAQMPGTAMLKDK